MHLSVSWLTMCFQMVAVFLILFMACSSFLLYLKSRSRSKLLPSECNLRYDKQQVMNKKTKRRPSGGTKHQKWKSLKNKKKSSTRNYDDTKMMMNFVLDSLVEGFRNFLNYFSFIKPTKKDKLTPTIDFIAMDCEMVGCGKKGSESLLARCSLVALSESKPSNLDNNQDATVQINVVYDVYVKPTKHVTDYRTQYSGITVEHLGRDEAVSWDACHSHVKKILKSTENRTVVLIGHGLENDFQVLKYWVSRISIFI
mmetsp:Transcript_16022/g.30227  ORF Transcript_16022/g.30227 Transcript_16022/m.30227 type:complete len:255 (+) Transcript_16022:77-841(+)